MPLCFDLVKRPHDLCRLQIRTQQLLHLSLPFKRLLPPTNRIPNDVESRNNFPTQFWKVGWTQTKSLVFWLLDLAPCSQFHTKPVEPRCLFCLIVLNNPPLFGFLEKKRAIHDSPLYSFRKTLSIINKYSVSSFFFLFFFSLLVVVVNRGGA